MVPRTLTALARRALTFARRLLVPTPAPIPQDILDALQAVADARQAAIDADVQKAADDVSLQAAQQALAASTATALSLHQDAGAKTDVLVAKIQAFAAS